MSAARARSRAEKAIFDIASTNGTTLCFLMSMCSTTSTSRSDFFGFIFFASSSRASNAFEAMVFTNGICVTQLFVVFNEVLLRFFAALRMIRICAELACTTANTTISYNRLVQLRAEIAARNQAYYSL